MNNHIFVVLSLAQGAALLPFCDAFTPVVSSGQLTQGDSCWLAVRDPSTSMTLNNLSTEWDLPWHENEHGEKGITTPKNLQVGGYWELWRKGRQHREDRATLFPQHPLLGTCCLALWQLHHSSRGGFH